MAARQLHLAFAALLPLAAASSLWLRWAPTYDLARFGSESCASRPRQADLLMVMGTIAKKMGPVVKQTYIQMAEPRWVIAVGACASSGGIFDTYSVLQGIDKVEYLLTCTYPAARPRPNRSWTASWKIQDLVRDESLRRSNTPEYKELLHSYGIE